MSKNTQKFSIWTSLKLLVYLFTNNQQQNEERIFFSPGSSPPSPSPSLLVCITHFSNATVPVWHCRLYLIRHRERCSVVISMLQQLSLSVKCHFDDKNDICSVSRPSLRSSPEFKVSSFAKSLMLKFGFPVTINTNLWNVRLNKVN